MGTTKKTLIISDLRGGQNGTDSPLLVAETQSVSAVNVDYWRGGIGRKRNGCAAVGLSFSGGASFAGTIGSLMTHIPTTGPTMAELWAVSSLSTTVDISRIAGSTNLWEDITPADAIVSPLLCRSATLDGKMFIGYDSAVNRLHVWDGTSLRRVGMATPNAPQTSNVGSGSYAAVLRYYKITYIELSGSTIVRRSEPSGATAVTPAGSGSAMGVLKPAAVSEGETHWELWGSADGATYWLIATTAVATTTYNDSTAPASYASVTGTLMSVAGDNTAPPSAKYLVSDGNRLVMAGCWETSGGYTTPKTSRVWFTPVLGASDIGDAERVPLDHYIDVNENDGDGICGLASHDGAIYVFKTEGIWKLIPTGVDETPYRIQVVSRSVGALGQNSIVAGDDESGNPCLYFCSLQGPQRIGAGGIQYLGRDNESTWQTNRAAIIANRTRAHAVYHRDKHQVWFWIPTASPPIPHLLWIFDTKQGRSGANGVIGGWTSFTGAMTYATCAVMYAATIGASSRSVEQAPYIGYYETGDEVAAIYRCDIGTQDIAANYAGLITTKAYALGGLGRNFGTGSPTLVGGKQTTATTITIGMSRDFGAETRTGTATLTAAGSETTVIKKVDGLDNTSCGVVQFTIGDAAAANVAWTLDALVVPYDVEEPR